MFYELRQTSRVVRIEAHANACTKHSPRPANLDGPLERSFDASADLFCLVRRSHVLYENRKLVPTQTEHGIVAANTCAKPVGDQEQRFVTGIMSQ